MGKVTITEFKQNKAYGEKTREMVLAFKSTLDESKVDCYEVEWWYTTGVGVAFNGGTITVNKGDKVGTKLYSVTFSPPEAALKVRCKVKTTAKKRKVNNKDTAYDLGKYTTDYGPGPGGTNWFVYETKPSDLSAPSMVMEDGYAIASATIPESALYTTHVEFQIYQYNSGWKLYKKSNLLKLGATMRASFKQSVTKGYNYKARIRGYYEKGKIYGEWSTFYPDDDGLRSNPSAPTNVKASGASDTSATITWNVVKSATSYTVEAAQEIKYFDSSTETKTMTVTADVHHAEFTGLETGKTWYFRVKATNETGDSDWSGDSSASGKTKLASVILGSKPSAPTTWSDSVTAKYDESVFLNWTHNTADGSKQTKAEIQIIVNGGGPYNMTVTGDCSRFELPTSGSKLEERQASSSTDYLTKNIKENATVISDMLHDSHITGHTYIINWKVRTYGIDTTKQSPYSIEREINVYEEPTVTINTVEDPYDTIQQVTGYPIEFKMIASPIEQKNIGFHLSISAKTTYEYTNESGEESTILKGTEIYSTYIQNPRNFSEIEYELEANSVILKRGEAYDVKVTASFGSGLTAKDSIVIVPVWQAGSLDGNFELLGLYDKDKYSMALKPSYIGSDGLHVKDCLIDVYRIGYDRSLTKIADNIPGNSDTWVIDSHVSLNLARYRLTVMSTITGEVDFDDITVDDYDGEKAIIIQWNEQFSSEVGDTSVPDNERFDDSANSSLLYLPYNIDISPSQSRDRELVKYIGREHPVSYYGTQKDETATWSTVIPKSDEDTLYKIRQLANYVGDVYVREPSGMGYWASIEVKYDIKHRELTIPVTFTISRVEGSELVI